MVAPFAAPDTVYNDAMSNETAVKEQKTRYEKLLATLGQPDLTKTKAFLADRETAERAEGLTDELIARVEAKLAEGTGQE